MKLKEIYNIGEKDFFDHNRVFKKSLRRRGKFLWVWISAILLLSVAMVFGALYALEHFKKPIEEIVLSGAVDIIESVEGEEGSLASLPKDGVLKIKTSEDVSVYELEARIDIEPMAEYDIKRTGSCKYQISFENIPENTLYNLRAVYQERVVNSWAFQVEKPFSVVAVSPQNILNDLSGAIEITFSHGDVEGFEEAFSIDPEVEGRFEHHGRKWSFIPNEPLAEGTLYTVTVKNSIFGPDHLSMENDYSFSFITRYGSSFAYMIPTGDDRIDSYLVNEAPVASVAYGAVDVSSASVEVYRLEGEQALKEAYQKYVRCDVISSEIMKMASVPQYQFEAKPMPAKDYGNIKDAAFIQYPEALPKGYYFSKIDIGGQVLFQLLQITDLSVYYLTAGEDYVVWINHAMTSSPIAGANVLLDGFSESKTSESGVAILRKGKSAEGDRCLRIENGDFPYIAFLPQSVSQEDGKSNYYSYLNFTAPIARSGEKIGLYGAVLPREGKISSSVVLKSDLFESDLALVTDENGMFFSNITIPKGIKTSQEISLWIGDLCLDAKSLQISNELPQYNIAVSVDKNAYLVGENIQFKAHVTYSDGSPAAGLKVTDGALFEGLTDHNGQVSGSIKAQFGEGNGDSVRFNEFSLSVKGEEEATSSANCYYLVISSAYLIESEYQDGDLAVGAFSIDFDGALKMDSDQFYTEEYDLNLLKGAHAELSLYAELHEISYIKARSGSIYNPYTKKVEDRYTYSAYDRVVRGIEMQTFNGIGHLQLPESATAEKDYYINIYLNDDRTKVLHKAYLSNNRYSSAYNRDNLYNLVASDTACAINEEVSFQIRQGNDNALIDGGSALYAVVSNGILDVYFSNSSRFAMEFKEEYAPDVLVYGAYFDGSHCYSLGSEYLRYDRDGAKLKIGMVADKDEYFAGDTINLKFNLTDSNGEPASATLLVYLMDEKLYQRGQLADPVNNFYASRCIQSKNYFGASYNDFNLNSAVNYKLKETEAYNWKKCAYAENQVLEAISVGAVGEGIATFTMPQEKAEWKVIAFAITNDGNIGMNAFDLCASRSLYTDFILANKIDSGDEGFITLKSSCPQAEMAEICDYKVVVCDADGQEVFADHVQGITDAYIKLNFGILAEGAYTIYVESRVLNFKDQLIATFEVKGSSEQALTVEESTGQLSHTFQLKQGSKGVLAIYGQEGSLWSVAQQLLRESGGSRADEVLVQKLMDAFYRDGFEAINALSVDALDGYNENGIKWNVEDETSDLKLTALTVLTVPDLLDQDDFEIYFDQYLNNQYASTRDVLLSYMGLAALNRPILEDLLSQYDKISDYTAEEAVYLALAFASAGDYQTAKAIYLQHIEPTVAEAEGERYFAVDGVAHLELTELVSVLSSEICLNEAPDYLRYCISHNGAGSILNFALISYLFDYAELNAGERVMTVSRNGKAEDYQISKGIPLAIKLEEAGEICLSSEDSDYGVVYSYFG